MKNEGGVTLTELMIAVALVGIGILGAVAAFSGIQKSIQYSKSRTLASNIAQEKMQLVMQKPYYEILVTTQAAARTDVSPTVPYDPFYFPPETVTEGGVTFTRYTYVQVVQENSGFIQILPPQTPDTGMRQITISVVWPSLSGSRVLQLQSVQNNPNTVMDSTWLKGTVTDAASGAVLVGALVNAAENIGWRDTADATGKYSINLVPGTFDFQASAPGYYSKVVTLSVPPSTVVNQPFALTAIGTGTVSGAAWLDNHIVISQVVASTGPSNSIEYVDLYNPTTAPYLVGTNASTNSPNIWMVVFDAAGNVQQRQLVYINTTIPANGYYLITNTGDGGGASAATHCDPITINSVTVNPDACWRFVGGPGPGSYNHTLQCNPVGGGGCSPSLNAGGFGIGTNGGLPWTGLAGTTKYDAIGWTGNGTTPNSFETSPAVPSSANGMMPGEAFVRRLDTTTVVSNTQGNAYDTDNNPVDFIDYPASIPFTPRTSATILSPMTGSPATGAIVSVIDGLSASSSATITGSPPYAKFAVPGVATGTWIVFIDSGAASSENDNVSVSLNATTSLANVILTTSGVTGMINGKVKDALGVPLNGITVTAGGSNSVTTGASGSYFIRLATGIYDVTANPNNANSSYATDVKSLVNVNLGDVTALADFTLPQGGRISGWISRDGTNPLPGVSVVALNGFGGEGDTEVSGNNGRFTLINLTTGTYTVQPVMDTKETSSPASLTGTVTAGSNIFVGTFTVTGAMGQVQGTVTSGGQPIKSGVLVLVSTAAIPAPPPVLSSATLTTAAYYSDSSDESGNYSVDVRGSTTSVYNVRAFYMHMVNQTPVISSGTCTSVSVTAGQPTTPSNSGCLAFTW